jgi:hypothetical protein
MASGGMMQRLQELSLPLKILSYAAVGIILLALATGIGAMAALLLGPDPRPLGGESRQEAGSPGEARPQKAGADKDKNAPKQQEDAAAEQRRVAARQGEAEYVGTVGEIQARAVEAFLESHDKLLRYDALTGADVEEMQASEAVLEAMNEQTADLAPPRKYGEQYKVFSAAIDELHEATRLAYGMAADPVAAAELGFDEYDGRVDKASGLLQRSNELLNRDYEAIENVREVSPEF